MWLSGRNYRVRRNSKHRSLEARVCFDRSQSLELSAAGTVSKGTGYRSGTREAAGGWDAGHVGPYE